MINVFQIVSSKSWGGAEQYAHDLMSRLRHDPEFYTEVVTRNYDSIIARYRRLEIPVSILRLKGLYDIETPVRFARQLKTGYNIVHVHNYRDAIMAVLAKHISENEHTHVVMTIHDVYHARNRYIMRRINKGVDAFIFVSDFSRNTFMSRPKSHLIDPAKTVVINDSVLEGDEDTRFTPNLREEMHMQPGQRLLMFHGRLTHDKGIDVVLRALTQLDKSTYRMAIVGEGQPKYVSLLKSFIVANQMVQNVSFLGARDDVHALIKQCDVGIVPSVAPEALGITNLEYMMHGKPIITTANGGQREYVDNGVNGIIVPPGDFKAVAAATQSLIANDQLLHDMGQNAKRKFDERLAFDKFYSDITALYQRVAGVDEIINRQIKNKSL